MRVAFLGSPPFAAGVFQRLVERGVRLVGLVTAPPRKSGRGQKEAVNPLVELARSKGIPVLRPESARDAEFKRAMREWGADLGVVASYGQILDQEVLDTPRLGCVNLHASLLPRWRGASPIQAALLAGDPVTGVCIQKMVLALDAGNVLADWQTAISDDDDATLLFERLMEMGAELTTDFIAGCTARGELPEGTPQEESAVTLCRKIRKADGRLDWSKSALEIDRLVRAMAGWPSAQTTLPDGSLLRVHAGAMLEGETSASPGTVLAATDSIVVACGTGAYRIDELQRQGKARMRAMEFLRGATCAAGDRLGGGDGA